MEYTDIVFTCRKCGHLLFVGENFINLSGLDKISEMDCPECGEEGCENWILNRAGNFNEEYGKRE